MTTLAGIAAEAYCTEFIKQGYLVDDTTRKDILEATLASLDAVFKELGVWTHPDFPGWIGLQETGQKYFFIRNSGVMDGMTMARRMDDPSEDADYDEGFSAAYRAAHAPKTCEQAMAYGDVVLQCNLEKGHDGMHRALP